MLLLSYAPNNSVKTHEQMMWRIAPAISRMHLLIDSYCMIETCTFQPMYSDNVFARNVQAAYVRRHNACLRK